MTDAVVERSRRMIRAGSKSFYAAARIYDPPTRDSAFMLYAWCRYCDDQIDLQELGHGLGTAPARSARQRLETLQGQTRRALAGEPVENPVFVGLRRVVVEHEIPERHPLELLEGFRMDVEERTYRRLEDTLDYCYHVAGVVGVMMSCVMGARDEETLDRAADLGIAFQMTNIARDVMDDARAGRVYLPLAWLEAAGVPPDELAERRHRGAVFEVVRRFLAEADRYYRSSSAGIARLGPRHAWAIATARGVYRDIGRLILKRGERAWDRRAVVGLPRKLQLVAYGGLEAIRSAALRRRAAAPPRAGLWSRPGRGSP